MPGPGFNSVPLHIRTFNRKMNELVFILYNEDLPRPVSDAIFTVLSEVQLEQAQSAVGSTQMHQLNSVLIGLANLLTGNQDKTESDIEAKKEQFINLLNEKYEEADFRSSKVKSAFLLILGLLLIAAAGVYIGLSDGAGILPASTFITMGVTMASAAAGSTIAYAGLICLLRTRSNKLAQAIADLVQVKAKHFLECDIKPNLFVSRSSLRNKPSSMNAVSSATNEDEALYAVPSVTKSSVEQTPALNRKLILLDFETAILRKEVTQASSANNEEDEGSIISSLSGSDSDDGDIIGDEEPATPLLGEGDAIMDAVKPARRSDLRRESFFVDPSMIVDDDDESEHEYQNVEVDDSILNKSHLKAQLLAAKQSGHHIVVCVPKHRGLDVVRTKVYVLKYIRQILAGDHSDGPAIELDRDDVIVRDPDLETRYADSYCEALKRYNALYAQSDQITTEKQGKRNVVWVGGKQPIGLDDCAQFVKVDQDSREHLKPMSNKLGTCLAYSPIMAILEGDEVRDKNDDLVAGLATLRYFIGQIDSAYSKKVESQSSKQLELTQNEMLLPYMKSLYLEVMKAQMNLCYEYNMLCKESTESKTQSSYTQLQDEQLKKKENEIVRQMIWLNGAVNEAQTLLRADSSTKLSGSAGRLERNAQFCSGHPRIGRRVAGIMFILAGLALLAAAAYIGVASHGVGILASYKLAILAAAATTAGVSLLSMTGGFHLIEQSRQSGVSKEVSRMAAKVESLVSSRAALSSASQLSV